MKPTKMRNNMIHRATHQTKSKQLGSALSKELREKYGKRSVRVIKGDSVAVVRGEFTGVIGKVSQVSTQKSGVVVEGIKKEQTRGGKYDVYVHASNLVVKSLNLDDKWRMAKLEGKDPSSMQRKEKEAAVREETADESHLSNDKPNADTDEAAVREETADESHLSNDKPNADTDEAAVREETVHKDNVPKETKTDEKYKRKGDEI